MPLLIMPLAVWLLMVGLIEPNPLSISLRGADAATKQGLGVSVTRHPVLWGDLLWAGSHMPPNGDGVALILFGGMTLLALTGFAGLDRRAQQRLGEERWHQLAATTSLVPFVVILTGQARLQISWRLAISAAAALAVYGWSVVPGACPADRGRSSEGTRRNNVPEVRSRLIRDSGRSGLAALGGPLRRDRHPIA